MADYDVTYSFASQAGSDTGWDYWNTDAGAHSVAAENTDQYWCWTSTGSTSSSTGPPSGTACIYTETSSPTAVGDEYTMTLTTDIDASEYALYMTFDNCMQGDAAGYQYLEVYNGTSWVEEDSWVGNTTTTFTSQGPYDFTGYSNSDFNIRIRNVVGGTTYYNDFAVTDVRIYGDLKVTDPEITDVETDEDIYIGQTGVTITGSAFEADGANSRVRIDSSAAGTGTSQTQTDTSWAATSIDFTVSQGSLSLGTNYLFVRNQSLDENPTGYTINLYSLHTTTSLNDTSFYDGQTLVEVNGTNFDFLQGMSKVYLCDSSDGSGINVEQVTTAWSDTKITFTVNTGALSIGTAYIIVGRNSFSQGDILERLSNAQTATIVATPTIPTITNFEDETVIAGETDVLLEGSGFESSQGTGGVFICPSATYGSAVEQTVATWSDTEIEVDVVLGALSYGINYLFLTNNTGYTNATGYQITLVAPASDEGLYKGSSFQSTITSAGLTITSFLVTDEG